MKSTVWVYAGTDNNNGKRIDAKATPLDVLPLCVCKHMSKTTSKSTPVCVFQVDPFFCVSFHSHPSSAILEIGATWLVRDFVWRRGCVTDGFPLKRSEYKIYKRNHREKKLDASKEEQGWKKKEK